MRAPDVQTPQVAPEAAPGFRAQALVDPGMGAEGQGIEELGAGIQSASDSLARVARIEQRRADATAAANQLTQLKHDTTTATLGKMPGDDAQDDDGDPGTPTSPSQKAGDAAFSGADKLSPQGVLNERGTSAVQYSGPTMTWLNGRAAELEEGLQSDQAKRLFRKAAMDHLEATRQTVYRHAGEQTHVAEEDALKASTGLTLQSVTDSYSDPKAVELHLQALEPSIRELATSKIDGDAKVAEVRGEAYRSVVGQYIANKDWKGARAAFDAHKDEIAYGPRGVDERNALEHTITTLKTQQEGDTQAKALVAGAKTDGDLYDVAKIATGALDAAKNLPKEQSDALDASLSKYQRLAEEANRALAGNHYTSSLSAFQKNFSLNDIDPADASWMQAHDPKGWHSILEEDVRHKAELRAAGRGPKSDAVTPEQISTGRVLADMAANADKYDPKQGGMTYDDLTRGYSSRVGKEGWEQLQKKYSEIQAGAAKGDRDTNLPLTAQRVILEMGHGPLWDKEKPEKMDDDAAAAFRSLSDKAEGFRREYKQQHKGQEPTTEDYEKKLAPEFQNVQTPGWLYGTNDTPLVKYQNAKSFRGDDGKLKPLAVPQDFADALKARKGGAELTPEQQSNYYIEYLRAGGGKVAAPAAPAAAPHAAAEPDRFNLDHPNVARVFGDTSTQGMPLLRAQLRPPPASTEPTKKEPEASPLTMLKNAKPDLLKVADLTGGE